MRSHPPVQSRCPCVHRTFHIGFQRKGSAVIRRHCSIFKLGHPGIFAFCGRRDLFGIDAADDEALVLAGEETGKKLKAETVAENTGTTARENSGREKESKNEERERRILELKSGGYSH